MKDLFAERFQALVWSRQRTMAETEYALRGAHANTVKNWSKGTTPGGSTWGGETRHYLDELAEFLNLSRGQLLAFWENGETEHLPDDLKRSIRRFRSFSRERQLLELRQLGWARKRGSHGET